MITVRQSLGVLGIIVSLSGTVLATPPTPVLQYKFDTAGSTQISTGSDALSLTTYSGSNTATDFVSGSPVGPSGRSSDLSLNLGAASSMNSTSSDPSGNYAPLNSIKAFTISAWINNTTPTGRAEYIFDLGASGNSIAFALTSSGSVTEEYIKVAGSTTVIAPFTLPAVTNQWTFIGVTFDSSTNVIFYKGSTAPGSALTSGTKSDNDSVPGSNTFVGIGNTNPGSLNQLQGAIDDVQFFSSALSASDLTTVRDADLPEPGCISLLGMGLLLAARWQRRSRAFHKQPTARSS